jgi:hypothetical protein
MGFFPYIEYQKVGKLYQISIGYLYSLNRPTVYKIRNLAHQQNC